MRVACHIGLTQRLAKLVAATLIGLASSCTSQAPPAHALAHPKVSASPSTTATLSETIGGMEAFVRQYYAAIGQAAATGDVAKLSTMMTPNCTCRAISTFIEQSTRNGRILGFRYTLISLRNPGLAGRDGVVLVVYDVPAVNVIDSTGKAIASAAPITRATESVTTIWINGRWYISGILRLP